MSVRMGSRQGVEGGRGERVRLTNARGEEKIENGKGGHRIHLHRGWKGERKRELGDGQD